MNSLSLDSRSDFDGLSLQPHHFGGPPFSPLQRVALSHPCLRPGDAHERGTTGGFALEA
jgi:hypothetical protein